MSHFRQRGRVPRRTRQSGWILLTTSLALIIMSVAAVVTYRAEIRKRDAQLAEGQADVLNSIRGAAETLAFEHWADFQAGLPVTRNGVTLAAGTNAGESMSPTVAQLRDMGLGIEGISDRGAYKTLVDAGYQIQYQRIPAGCEASPNGSECNIAGMVCLDQPVRDPRTPADSIDGEGIGKMLMRIGGNGGASLLGVDGGNIVGFEGGWNATNPIAGSPAGIVCARFGFGSSGFAKFLIEHETRDPDFQNNVTIGGGVHVKSTAVLGASCAGNPEGMAMWGEVDGNPVWLRCEAGVWEPANGITYANAGDTCTVDSAFAMTTGGIALVCSNGHWVSSEQKGIRSAAYYQHGSTIPVPACGTGLTPSAVIAAVSASNIIGINNTGNNTGSFQADIDPATWGVSVTGADGSPAGDSATALVLTFCNPS